MNPEYHKGQLCIHQLMMCQEGYCSECDIHAQHERYIKQFDGELLADIRHEKELSSERKRLVPAHRGSV